MALKWTWGLFTQGRSLFIINKAYKDKELQQDQAGDFYDNCSPHVNVMNYMNSSYYVQEAEGMSYFCLKGGG